MSEPFHITVRASSTPQYPDCSRRWAARHVQALTSAAGFNVRELPSTVGACVGTATHSGVGYILGEKVDTGTLGNATESDQRALQSLDEAVGRGCMWDDTTSNMNTAQKQVLRQVATFRLHTAHLLKPVAIEQRLTAKMSDRMTVSGQADICEDDSIHDLKTGVMRRANAAQYGTYSLLRRSFGHEVNRLVEVYVPRARVTKPQPDPELHFIPVEAAEQAAEGILRRIERDVTEFEKNGEPWAFLANPTSMLCSDKYCPAHGTTFCRVHKE